VTAGGKLLIINIPATKLASPPCRATHTQAHGAYTGNDRSGLDTQLAQCGHDNNNENPDIHVLVVIRGIGLCGCEDLGDLVIVLLGVIRRDRHVRKKAFYQSRYIVPHYSVDISFGCDLIQLKMRPYIEGQESVY